MGKLSTTPDTMAALVLRGNDVITTINAVPQSVAHVAHTFKVWHKVWHTLPIIDEVCYGMINAVPQSGVGFFASIALAKTGRGQVMTHVSGPFCTRSR